MAKTFRTILAIAASASVLLALGGCALPGTSEDYSSTAQQLQEPMDEATRAIDQVRGTRSALDALDTSLTRSLDQTNDVIAVLLPKAAEDDAAAGLLDAARRQRAFLQSAIATARARSRGSIANSVRQMEQQGQAASDAYGRLRTSHPDLAGFLPAASTFNAGRLRDAARTATPEKKTKQASTPNPAAAAPAAATRPVAPATSGDVNGRAVLDRSCDPNIKFDPSTTGCSFAQDVFRAYSAATQSGASYDTVVSAQGITMTCTLDAGTVTCFGARERLVEFPRWASDAY